MRKLINLFFNRVTISVLLLLIQLSWGLLFIYKFSRYSTEISLLFILLSIVMFLWIVISKDNPVIKIAWITLIGLVPVFGSLFYLIASNKKPTRKLRKSIENNENILREAQNFNEIEMEDRIKAISKYVSNNNLFPAFKNTKVKYFELGELMFQSMLEDLKNAKKFIFFEYFIVAESKMWNDMKDIFLQKAQEGVDIRIMYDDLGSLPVLPKNFKQELESYGIKVVPFNPLVPFLALGMNNRDHRKILVIDGNIAYNGGINIADEYINLDSKFGHWKDTGLRLEGEGVYNLTLMFLTIWNVYCEENLSDNISKYRPSISISNEKGYVQSFSDSPLDNELLSENLYMDILWQAKDYVYIYTPYLIIDNEMTVALTMAAKRGVDVRIVVPKIPDKKIVYNLTQSYFKPLIESGVRIYLYTPGFIHAKSYVSDDNVAVVGTINMDYRSLYLHFECGTFMVGVDAIKDIKQDCINTFSISEEVKLENIEQGMLKTLYQAALRVLSPLF